MAEHGGASRDLGAVGASGATRSPPAQPHPAAPAGESSSIARARGPCAPREHDVYALGDRIDNDARFAARELAHHMRDFAFERVLALAVIRALAQHKRFHHAGQRFERQLGMGDDDRIARRAAHDGALKLERMSESYLHPLLHGERLHVPDPHHPGDPAASGRARGVRRRPGAHAGRPMHPMLSGLFSLLAIAAGVLLALLALAYWRQDAMIFFPRPNDPMLALKQRDKRVEIRSG